MNVISIIGRVANDPKFGKTKSGIATARFTVASEKTRRAKYGEEPESNFTTIELYGNEGVHEYLKKGTPVAVCAARIQTSSYKNAEGRTVYSWTVVSNSIELLPAGKQNGSTNVDLIGRLTADCKTSYTKGTNTCITEFTLAVDRRGKEKTADFIPIKIIGKLGESLGRYLVKGKMVNIKGRLDTGSFKRSDGTVAYTWNVLADDVYLMGDGKKKAQEEPSEPIKQEAQEAPQEELESTGFVSLPDEFDEEYFDEEF